MNGTGSSGVPKEHHLAGAWRVALSLEDRGPLVLVDYFKSR